MELPLSRYQGISKGQIQDSVKLASPFSFDSKPFLFSRPGRRINGRKWRRPFSHTKFSLLEKNLRPKPKPKPKLPKFEVGKEEQTKFKETQMNKRTLGLCDQIEKLVFHKRYQEALELFEILEIEGGHEVPNSTYDALVIACIGLRSIRGVKRVSSYMACTGFEPDLYMYNRMLLMHVKCGMTVDARKLFDEMPQRSLVSWNTMLAGLVDVSASIEAFELFLTMWSEFSEADSRTFATMIRATVGLELKYLGTQLHSCVLKMGVYDDIFVACALIDMYSKCGSIEDAQFVFDEMPVKMTVGWNTIITGYALHGYSEEVLSSYYEMQDAGVPMDHFTFSVVVRLCARLGSLEHAKQAHAGLVRHGFGIDMVASTTLVDLYSK